MQVIKKSAKFSSKVALLFPGDGIGPEISDAAVNMINATGASID